MIKVILCYQDNTVDYDETPYKKIHVKNEEEFWERYNSNNEYVRCDDEHTFSVYLKKDKITEIRIEKVMGDRRMGLTKEQLQKNLFKSLCDLYDRNKNDRTKQIHRGGITFTCIELRMNDDAMEEIRKWAKDE